MENIYLQTLGTYRLFVDVSKITKDVDQYLEDMLKNELEGKCQSDGYVKRESVRLMKRSLGYMSGSHFTGKITFDIVYSCDICNPVVGNVIKARVLNINKLGFLAENGPLMMLVARQYYENKELFKDLEVNQEVMIEVIGKRFQLNDHKIEIIGKIYQPGGSGNNGNQGEKIITVPTTRGRTQTQSTTQVPSSLAMETKKKKNGSNVGNVANVENIENVTNTPAIASNVEEGEESEIEEEEGEDVESNYEEEEEEAEDF